MDDTILIAGIQNLSGDSKTRSIEQHFYGSGSHIGGTEQGTSYEQVDRSLEFVEDYKFRIIF